MFDLESVQEIGNPIRKSTTSFFGEKFSYEYKINTKSKKKYILKVDFFEWDICVVKFYPKKFSSHPEKYKLRIGKDFNTFREVLTAVLKLCLKLYKQNPALGFAFFGEWDEKDVSAKRTQSQRQNIYLRLVFSKIKYDENFIFYPSQEDNEGVENFLLILPKSREPDIYKIETRLTKEYKEIFEKMRIPSSI
ncbi:MAG TPA: hypothetical protein DIU39_09215 [Flavobacteriales bacterium]|nr:hypothetical protein [Flavobacteriales bacterium]